MTIIDKIKTSVEGATGLPFLYHAAGEINELVARANSLPISFAFLLDSGTIEDVNGRYHERVTLAVMFTDKTEFDFNALENEEIIDRMKIKAYKWLDSLRNSNDLQIVSVNSTQRLYDTTTDILTGYAVNITLQDMQGVGECELPEVVIPITENGIYNVVGADKVDVKLFVTLKDLYVTRNGVYNPQDFGAYGFGSVNVNVRGEEDLEPAYDWLKNRVKGSEDGTIPAIPLREPLDITNLVENLSVLDNRRINANQEIEDGTSLLRLVGSAVTNITTLDDTNIGWTNAVVSLNGFDNLRYVKLGAKNIMNPHIASRSITAFFNQTIESIEAPYLEFIGERIDSQYNYQYVCYALARQINAEEIYFPNLKRIYNATGKGGTDPNSIPALGYLPNCKKITLPKLSDIQTCASAWNNKGSGTQCLATAPECLELITAIGGSTNRENANETGYKFIVSPKLRKFVLGGVLAIDNDHGLFDTTSTDLIHLELGGAECSLNMQKWNPTNALRTDTTAEDYVDLREDMAFANNLEQFLYNFQTYIADRVEDRTGQSALRLTVMPAIYAALETQEGQTILATLTNKNWTVVQY